MAGPVLEAIKNKRNWASKVPAQNLFFVIYFLLVSTFAFYMIKFNPLFFKDFGNS